MQIKSLKTNSSALAATANPGPVQEKISPRFFRQDNNRLFACHHQPPVSAELSQAVLICNSAGHEYERGHRPMRQLAIQIARSGHHVMRFDYFGTGDSAGDYSQATIAQWKVDIADAIDECKHQACRDQVCVMGMRLGATLAAQVAANRIDVKTLVLYEPIVNGNKLLSEWETEQEKVSSPLASDDHNEILGFPLTSTFRSEIADELTLPIPSTGLRQVLILSHSPENTSIKELSTNLKAHGARVSVKLADAKPVWLRQASDAVVPYKLLRQITSWLQESQT